MVSKLQRSSSLQHPQQCWGHRHVWPCFGFSMGAKELNSSPLVCIASTLITEPSPPHSEIFLLLFCLVLVLGIEHRPCVSKADLYHWAKDTAPALDCSSPYLDPNGLLEREKIKASLSRTFGLLPELCESWFWLVLPVPLLPVWRSLEIPIGHSLDSLRSLGFVVGIYLFILSWTYIVRCVPNIKSSLDCCLHCRLRMLMRLLPKQSIFLCPKMGSERRGSLIYIWMLWVSCLPWSCV